MLINKLKLPENIEHFANMRQWGRWEAILEWIDEAALDISVIVHDGESCVQIDLYYQKSYITSIRAYPHREHDLDDAWRLGDALDVMYEMAR